MRFNGFTAFPVGCKFSDKNILPSTFEGNPDSKDPLYSSENGIYQPGCGLDNVMLSWGHDEVRFTFIRSLRQFADVGLKYLYHVFKDQSTLPEEALAMIRYHSFYPYVSRNLYGCPLGLIRTPSAGTVKAHIPISPMLRTKRLSRLYALSTHTISTAKVMSHAMLKSSDPITKASSRNSSLL